MNKYPDFFLKSKNLLQRKYEALRAFHVDNLSSKDIANMFGYSVDYFNKVRSEFHKQLSIGTLSGFFITKKTGPPIKPTDKNIETLIVTLRQQELSVPDIRVVLSSKGTYMSTRGIDSILKRYNISRLPKRTKNTAMTLNVPEKIKPDASVQVNIGDLERKTYRTIDGGIFYFLPLLIKLNIHKLVDRAGFPGTKVLSNLNFFLSLLSLKLMDKERLSHTHALSFDAGLGLFAGLNVLPKDAAMSAYSYNITKKMNNDFLKLLAAEVLKHSEFSGDINLDFTAIPYWGDKKVIEKNWSGTRRHALKSILAAIAQDPDSGILYYGNACVKKKESRCEVLQFVDFWKRGKLNDLKCLIFDSKFTVLENLRKLDKDGIKFITIRQRNPGLMEEFKDNSKKRWNKVHLDTLKRKHKDIFVNDTKIIIEKYDKSHKIRQVVMKNHGREAPAFILTNDFTLTAKQIITKYARRWMVEKAISEEMDFFHLNSLSSSMVIKVDFDLTMTILANTLYKLLANKLMGYEKETAKSIYVNFVHNGADIEIREKEIKVKLLKKAHNPIIMESDLFTEKIKIPWLNNYTLNFSTQNTA